MPRDKVRAIAIIEITPARVNERSFLVWPMYSRMGAKKASTVARLFEAPMSGWDSLEK